MSRQKQSSLVILLMSTAGYVLMFPVIAWADNCGSFSDCFATMASAAATIASIATGTALLSAIAGLFGGGGSNINDAESSWLDAIPGASTAEAATADVMSHVVENPDWGLAAASLFGLVNDSLGVMAGAGAFMIPEPTMATKIWGGAEIGKSLAGLYFDSSNFVNALTGGPEGPSSLANYITNKIAPGNTTIAALGTVADLGIDLSNTLTVTHSINLGNGTVYPSSTPFGAASERWTANVDPSVTSQVFTGADIIGKTATTINNVWKEPSSTSVGGN